VGKGAAGVSVNAAGTVSALSINGAKVAVVDKVDLGNDKSGPMHVAITPDGKRALVSRDGDHKVTMLAIDAANKVTLTNRGAHRAVRSRVR
jgi:DNA-binding beta-propeller fold protein YncE